MYVKSVKLFSSIFHLNFVLNLKKHTIEDCLRFQEICVDHEFVGVCKEVGKNPLNPKEPMLTLDLIDTSTSEDVYLNKQLVDEGRARLYSTS
ncbi:unnamed protein product [Leptidea sinapis]|uniref:Uncharacterized protein n=1 Tax=Leptidea sinapis TaxID=189913 RepID=A0A5E4PR18_9NEOP|nr:unnamed protein product [Leptidea sinapis]